ncbi:prepilin-type N-terminal cleavage/methylation domain-containing protein [Opitutaceae bacterium TAV1]|nr:prepilin-type N-terminal cleavage/methylation domain-containing protein [Opitutaceae bacterium TAV1]
MICRILPRFRPLPPAGVRSRRGVTLIELLAVITLIGVLAGLVIAGIGHIRNLARIATCRSNLRQAGVAMLNYATDSRDLLPGPLWRGQGPVYNSDASGSFDTGSGNLANFLVPYFGLQPPPPSTEMRAQALSCPAWLNSGHAPQTSICYYSTGETGADDGSGYFPFGRYSSNPDNLVRPMQISALPEPATTVALREFDRKQLPEDSSSFYATDPRVPPRPVHGNVRNALYFDGHVGPMR